MTPFHIVRIALVLAAMSGQRATDSRVLMGRVTDQLGNGLPGAEVLITAAPISSGTTDARQRVAATTNERGEYVIPSVPESWGSTIVTVRMQGFRTDSHEVAIARGQNLLDVGLMVGRLADSPWYQVRGTVTSAAGTPLPDTTVTLRHVYQPSLFYQVRTDRQGSFRLRTMESGDYVLTAALPGYAAAVVGMELRNKYAVSSDVTLRRAK